MQWNIKLFYLELDVNAPQKYQKRVHYWYNVYAQHETTNKASGIFYDITLYNLDSVEHTEREHILKTPSSSLCRINGNICNYVNYAVSIDSC